MFKVFASNLWNLCIFGDSERLCHSELDDKGLTTLVKG